MYKRIIMSVLVCCVQLSAMEKSGNDPRDQLFSIISIEKKRIPLPYKYAQHMNVFSPFNPDNLSFRSQHSAREINNFLHVLDKIDNKTISQACFPLQHQCDVIPTQVQVPLSLYEEFDLRLNPEVAHNRKPIELMSVARELKDEQAMLVFVSFFIEKKYHDNMISSLISWSQRMSFKDDINKICEKTYEPKLKGKEDSNDKLAVFNRVGQNGIANTSRTLVAMIGDEEKNCIVVKNSVGTTKAILVGYDKQSFSCPTFSGDDSQFACIQNIHDSDGDGFILSIWYVDTWQLLTKVRFSGAGNIHNLALNHDGTKLVASVQVKKLVSPEAENYTSEYKNIILDVSNKKAKIIDCIPVRSIENTLYCRSDGTFVTSSDPLVFYQWAFNKVSENADKDFYFIQKIFLYALYERKHAKEIGLSHEIKPFIVPLITGYVQDYVMQSLPKKVKAWAEQVQRKYKFTS